MDTVTTLDHVQLAAPIIASIIIAFVAGFIVAVWLLVMFVEIKREAPT